MPDLGERMTERRLDEISRELTRIYSEAEKDLQRKFNAYTRSFLEKDRRMTAAYAAGRITKEKRDQWLRGQVFTGQQWRARVEQMAVSLVHVEEMAVDIIRNGQFDCYADNTNYFEFRIDHDMGFLASFSIYSTETVARLVKDQPELLRRRYVDGEKSEAWNVKVINNCITQGIIQGESIPQIAKRMARDTASTDMKAMTRYARTAMTAAQNAGRIEAMNNCLKQGIYVRKIWLAVGDDRTRDAHAELDGHVAEVNTPFESILGPIMYPGDPNASDENVWNCRCALGYDYPGIAESEAEYADEETEFEDWLEEHEAA